MSDITSPLSTLDTDSIELFSFNHQTFTAKACDIYDGDTCSMVFFFRGEPVKYRCRCYGYDSPEMKPLLSKVGREEEMRLAKQSKERFGELVQKGKAGLVEIKCGEFDKYGRILVTVYNGIDTKSVNDLMVEEGHGKPYFGGHKS